MWCWCSLPCSCCSNGQTVWAGWERRWVSSRCRVDGEGRGRAGIMRQIRDGGRWEANWKQEPPPVFLHLGALDRSWWTGQGRSTRSGTYRRGGWTRQVPSSGRGRRACWASLRGPVGRPWDVQTCTSSRAREGRPAVDWAERRRPSVSAAVPIHLPTARALDGRPVACALRGIRTRPSAPASDFRPFLTRTW